MIITEINVNWSNFTYVFLADYMICKGYSSSKLHDICFAMTYCPPISHPWPNDQQASSIYVTQKGASSIPWYLSSSSANMLSCWTLRLAACLIPVWPPVPFSCLATSSFSLSSHQLAVPVWPPVPCPCVATSSSLSLSGRQFLVPVWPPISCWPWPPVSSLCLAAN